MNFIFWQNIVSIHQIPFLRELACEHNVTLCVEQAMSSVRRKEGWEMPSSDNFDIIIAPDSRQIDEMMDRANVKHVFSGINSYPMVYAAFKKAAARNLDITVLAEPYNPYGLKGVFRRLKYIALFAKYKETITRMLVTGSRAIQCYSKCGMPIRKLHQWGYFTAVPPSMSDADIIHKKPTVIYVGRLDSNKNILSVIADSKKWGHLFYDFIIVGDGPLRNELEETIYGYGQYHYVGTKSNSEVTKLLANADVLVLPSFCDGWGAVVNEALLAGTPALVSDMCGASILVENSNRGVMVPVNGFAESLKEYLSSPNAIVTSRRREEIRQWAIENISPQAAAQYFQQIFINDNTQAPWIVNQ